MTKTVTLLGSSSGRNAGDAALISGIMESIDDACGEKLRYEIPTIRPSFIRNTYHQNAIPVSMLPWNGSLKMLGIPTYRSVMNSDLSLVFDAILFDRALYNPLFNFLSTLYLLLPRAKRQGKRLCFFNVGVGPVRTPAGRRMLRDLSEEMDFITVRDEDSYQLLREIGVTNPRMVIGADAALNVIPAAEKRVDQILSELGLSGAGEILAVNVNSYLDTWADVSGRAGAKLSQEDFLTVYSNALRKVLQRISVPVLFVCTQYQDIALTKELLFRTRYSGKVAYADNKTYNHFELKGLLGRVSLLFAMRLHAMILASGSHTPIFGLSYQPKIDHFFRTVGLSSETIHFDRFSEDEISSALERAWEKRTQIRKILETTIPVKKQEALKAARLAALVLRGEKVDDAIVALLPGNNGMERSTASR